MTLAFCDLKGFTAYAEAHGDAAAVAAVERFAALVAAELGDHGTIVKALGDGYMLAFPTPADAVGAGLRMVARCTTGAAWRFTRASITGSRRLATATTSAGRSTSRHDYWALPEMGEFVASEVVVTATREGFDWKPGGPQRLRGVGEPVGISRLRIAVGDRRRAPTCIPRKGTHHLCFGSRITHQEGRVGIEAGAPVAPEPWMGRRTVTQVPSETATGGTSSGEAVDDARHDPHDPAYWSSLSPEEISEVVSRLTDGIVILGPDWRYRYLNQPAATMLGDRRVEDLLGKNIWSEFPDDVALTFRLAYERAAREGTPGRLVEYFEPYDRWFENRIFPQEDNQTSRFPTKRWPR